MSDREWPPDDEHEHYQPQIDALIDEVNEKAARIAQLEAENAELRHDIAKALGNHAADLTAETKAEPERPFAWYRKDGVFDCFHRGDWPPPEPDDTPWQPLYLSPEGRPASKTKAEPCPMCQGRGWTIERTYSKNGMVESKEIDCPDCQAKTSGKPEYPYQEPSNVPAQSLNTSNRGGK